MAMISEHEKPVVLLSQAKNKLKEIKDRMEHPQYQLWEENIDTQHTLASLYKEFIVTTVLYSLIKRKKDEKGDIQWIKERLENILALVKDLEPPVPPTMHRICGWGYMTGDEYRTTFTNFVKECKKNLRLNN